MKTKITLLLTVLLLSVATGFAQTSGTTGTLTWTLENGTLTISGAGEMEDYSYPDYAPWNSNSSSITTVIIEDGVTSIGDYAFSFCRSLATVTIPDGVTSIGDGAFEACISLTSVTIPNGVTSIGEYAFSSCSSLATVTIPDGVTSIGKYAFSYCISLTSVTIPESVTSIGHGAFYYCNRLTAINVDENNDYYTSANGVLFNKEKTTLIQYPAGKTDADYTIPESVTGIVNYAFSMCSSLAAVNIPNRVTSIGDAAFSYCGSLVSVTIGNSVTSIGDEAFHYCGSLASVTIPESVTSIGDEAFASCQNLESVIIGNRVTSIGDMAFDFCISLTSVTIPESVTSIGDGAFSYCGGLVSVTIGNSVTSIGEYAFYGCSSLASVTNLNPEPQEISLRVFTGITLSQVKLIVPHGTVEAYKAAEVWKDFNIVEDGSGSGIASVEVDELQISVADGVLKIASYAGGEVRIFDISGRAVGAKNFSPLRNGAATINISTLPAGVYIVQIGNRTGKFIK
ncbi:MAG: leucine-rich repeat protein [Dysgonamonadaceae bacterium]|jgi:hypothetical protein|nr:leucine-rich repeat protein [Dysgonamonadaceae bacterium]